MWCPQSQPSRPRILVVNDTQFPVPIYPILGVHSDARVELARPARRAACRFSVFTRRETGCIPLDATNKHTESIRPKMAALPATAAIPATADPPAMASTPTVALFASV